MPVAAALEARAVITRPFAGEGIRVTVGTPEEDDVFLARARRRPVLAPGGLTSQLPPAAAPAR